MENVFHNGEIGVQARTGQRKMAQMVGRMIQPTIPPGLSHFIEKQPVVYVSSVDSHQSVWLSLLTGGPGFIEVPDDKGVIFHKDLIRSHSKDIFFQNIEGNPSVGTLFLEPSTRRRFRVNGSSVQDSSSIQINVREAYGNCPKYIQRAALSLSKSAASAMPQTSTGNVLGSYEKEWISNSDTFFVATRSLDGQMDTSHRGGNPGFISVSPDGVLRIPDYPGNGMFNTLGNLYENPKVGLLLVNFAKGETLQLTGTGEIHFDQKSSEDQLLSGGTGLFWTFRIEKWIRTENHHAANWEFLEYSPFNP